MSDNMVTVHIDLNGATHLVGRLWSHVRKGRESASFEYDKSWFANPYRFSIDPQLMLAPGTFHTEPDKLMFGCMGDSAPDRWGRVLMRRAESHQARLENRDNSTLFEMDFLLRVNDQSRQGALRFSSSMGNTYLSEKDHTIPPLVDLPRLLAASDRFLADAESALDLQLLLAPGSSLGGARPKASVRDVNGRLLIAKFPSKSDEVSVMLWEAVALTLAKQAGLTVSSFRIEKVMNSPILLIERFDRKDKMRIPFLSAMTMLGANDNERHSYLEIVDALRQYGSSPKRDCQQLWRRIVFSILISNTDDHLRNHGFLYEDQKGWCLSPAYDLNPTSISVKPRILTTAINYDECSASIELALSVCAEFGLKIEQARSIAKEIAIAVSCWREVAACYGIKKIEINKIDSAFEHDDLKKALRY